MGVICSCSYLNFQGGDVERCGFIKVIRSLGLLLSEGTVPF